MIGAMPKRTPKDETPDLELDPDAWPRFEKLVKAAAKLGPQPRAKQKKPESAKAPDK